MKVMLHPPKWQVVCLFSLFCVFLLGLILLRYAYESHKSRKTASPQVDHQFVDRGPHAFSVDEEISLIRLDADDADNEANQQSTPWIGKSLLSILTEGTPKPKAARRTLVTDWEDYVVEIGKNYTVFYYHPVNLSQPSLQRRVNAFRSELYSNPPMARKQEIRKEMKALLEHAKFIKAKHEMVFLPPHGAHTDHDHDHPHSQAHDGHDHHDYHDHHHTHDTKDTK